MKLSIEQILTPFDKDKENLITILQRVQKEYGYLSEQSMSEIAKFLNITKSNVYGVASFYKQFKFTPRGRKHILVCRGTSCHVNNAPEILKEIERVLNIKAGETSLDNEYSLETVACIGSCALSPCIMINDEVKAKLNVKDIKKLFSEYKPK